jgi:acetoin utilization protein AcuB
MRISDIMTKDVKTVPPTSTVGEAADLMRRKRIRHLVVKKGGRVIGVVSDRDVRSPSFFAEPLTEVMTEPAITIGPNDTVRTAAKRMSSRGVSSLPVVEHGELVGIVTVADLLHLLARVA